jgi:hypothetical protein
LRVLYVLQKSPQDAVHDTVFLHKILISLTFQDSQLCFLKIFSFLQFNFQLCSHTGSADLQKTRILSSPTQVQPSCTGFSVLIYTEFSDILHMIISSPTQDSKLSYTYKDSQLIFTVFSLLQFRIFRSFKVHNLSSFTVKDSQLFHSPGFSALPQARILSSSTVHESQLFHSPGFSALPKSRILSSSTVHDSQLFHSLGFSALPQSMILSSSTVHDSQLFHSP